jgi:hypothetical protein
MGWRVDYMGTVKHFHSLKAAERYASMMYRGRVTVSEEDQPFIITNPGETQRAAKRAKGVDTGR